MDAFYVYVVELSPLPGHKPAFYVGSTAFRPSIKFLRHKFSKRQATSRHVRRRGRRLRPDLYSHLNPLPSREDAKRAEKRLAARLRSRDFEVYGACGRRQGCWI